MNLTNIILHESYKIWVGVRVMRRERKVAAWGQERISRVTLLVCFPTQVSSIRAPSLPTIYQATHCIYTQISVWHYTRNIIQKFKTKQPEALTRSCLIGQLLSSILILSSSAKDCTVASIIMNPLCKILYVKDSRLELKIYICILFYSNYIFRILS